MKRCDDHKQNKNIPTNIDKPTWLTKALQHTLKNAMSAALVESVADLALSMLHEPEKLLERPPSVEIAIRINKQCAEWKIFSPVYSNQNWM